MKHKSESQATLCGASFQEIFSKGRNHLDTLSVVKVQRRETVFVPMDKIFHLKINSKIASVTLGWSKSTLDKQHL